MNEVWKAVVGFEDLFSVSNTGKIKSKRTGKVLKQNLAKSGYLTVATKVGGRSGKNYCFRMHRVVAEAFLDKPFEDAVVNHINGCKHDNYVTNLEWVSQQENMQHAYRLGLCQPPSNETKKKLQDAQLVKDMYKTGSYSQRELAQRFGVSKTTIHLLLNGLTYN